MTSPLSSRVDCFSVFSALDPSALPRLVNVFALFGRVPCRFHSTVSGDQLVVDVQVEGLVPGEADLLAKKLGRVVTVTQVLWSEKRLAAA